MLTDAEQDFDDANADADITKDGVAYDPFDDTPQPLPIWWDAHLRAA